jgi:hypothetical protein
MATKLMIFPRAPNGLFVDDSRLVEELLPWQVLNYGQVATQIALWQDVESM